MKRSALHRLTALLVAGAFGLGSGANAVASLYCSHHAGVHGSAAVESPRSGHSPVHQPGGPGHADGAGHAHGPDDAHGADHAHGSDPVPERARGPSDHDSHDEGSCGCVGPCQGSAAPLASPPAGESRLAPAVERASAAPDRAGTDPRSTPYFLPFANGPPAAS